MSDRARARRDGPPVEPGGVRALVLVPFGLVLAVLVVPVTLVAGLLVEAAAIVLGVRTLRRARRNARVAPGARAAVVGGALATVLLLLALTSLLVFYDEYVAFDRCVGRAITESARAECFATFQTDVERRIQR